MFKHLDRTFISAFIERWYPDTNTFHLPCGEMTITPRDVTHILGLPMVGNSIKGGNRLSMERAIILMDTCLGIKASEFKKIYKEKDGFIVSMKWLKETFRGSVTNKSSDEAIARAVRAYLLYVFGSIIFPNKSGNRIPITYLENFIDLNTVNQINWGSGLLTYLYKQMGDASHVKCAKIGGYLTLLQAWIYIHFPSFTDDVAEWEDYYNGKFPMAREYIPLPTINKGVEDVVVIRKLLDDMPAKKIQWNPYPRAEIDERVILSTGGFCERYHPDRIVRQFGYVQGIPSAPIILEPMKHDSMHVIHNGEQVPSDHPSKCDDRYLAWFTSISHVRVHPPEERGNDLIWNEGVHKAIVRLEKQVLSDEAKKSRPSASTLAMKDAINYLRSIPNYKAPTLNDVSSIEGEDVVYRVNREVRSKHVHDKNVGKEPHKTTESKVHHEVRSKHLHDKHTTKKPRKD